MSGETFFWLLFVGFIFYIIGKILNWFRSLDPKDKRDVLIGIFGGSTSERSEHSNYDENNYGKYVIQYRSGGSWVDGPGSNNERIAESMFDSFCENDPRASKRCRLVYKVSGHVKSVLSTN